MAKANGPIFAFGRSTMTSEARAVRALRGLERAWREHRDDLTLVAALLGEVFDCAENGKGSLAEGARWACDYYERFGEPALRRAICDTLMSPGKIARAPASGGMVTASSLHAARAGAAVLEAGGNAVDAAVAACLALGVADPANTSILGRCQMLVVPPGGSAVAMDGASESPASVPPRRRGDPLRAGFATVPVPGSPRALESALARWGRRPLAEVIRPAIALAEAGFTVPPRLGSIWSGLASELARDPAASRCLLKPGGHAYLPGEHLSQPALGAFLRRLGDAGSDLLAEGPEAHGLAEHVKRHGGFLSIGDLRAYAPRRGEVLSARYRDWEVRTVGGQGWGHTLVEMLNLLGHFEPPPPAPSSEDAVLLALVMGVSLADRPQELGTLRPKPDGHRLETIASDDFARARSADIGRNIDQPGTLIAEIVAAHTASIGGEDRDTTHLSVIDAEGRAVALTTSIGPHFGSRVAAPEQGALFAHSYRMASDPTPGARDQTEMTPTVLLRNDRPALVLGAAGSERIPCAILQVIVNVVDRGWDVSDAVAAPRLLWKNGRLRLHADFALEPRRRLRERGFPLELAGRSHVNHLGIVQAAAVDVDGAITGVADPAYDGAAVAAR